jgi:hypothetical protein
MAITPERPNGERSDSTPSRRRKPPRPDQVPAALHEHHWLVDRAADPPTMMGSSDAGRARQYSPLVLDRSQLLGRFIESLLRSEELEHKRFCAQNEAIDEMRG